jgi:hypothetical protein
MAVQVAQVLTNPLSVRAYATASTSSALHLTSEGWYKSGVLGASTLCGSPVYRLMPEFRPSEATCQVCKRRYELAMAHPPPKPSELGVGAWIVLVVVIAGMVTLFVVIAIAVSHTGQTTPLGDGPSRTAARYSNTCGLRQSWAATNTRTKRPRG